MKKYSIILILAAAAFFAGCKDDKENRPDYSKSVETLEALNVRENFATLQASYAGNASEAVEWGFYFSEKPIAEGGYQTLVTHGKVAAGEFYRSVEELVIGKKYYFEAYMKLSDGTVYRGGEKSFTSFVYTEPAVSTLPAEDIVQDAATLRGMLDDDGGDSKAQVGFYWGISPETESMTKVGPEYIVRAPDGTFTLRLDGLVLGTVYYCRAWITNVLGVEVLAGETESFKTKAPVIVSINEMDYAYRRVNVTATSLKLSLRVESIVNLDKYGVYWGPTDSSQPTFAAGGALVPVPGQADTYDYTVTISSGLGSASDCYFYPYAENEDGTQSNSIAPAYIRTAVDGGYQWLTKEQTTLNAYYNITQPGLTDTKTPLTYYELDPIETADYIYYVLDRNMGSTNPYETGSTSPYYYLSTTFNSSMFAAQGYNYQWGMSRPSLCPDEATSAKVNVAPWHWNNNSTPNPTVPEPNTVEPLNQWPTGPITVGTVSYEHTGKVCPGEYSIPLAADWSKMFDAVTDKTTAGLWQAMRLGMTSRRWYGGQQLGTNGQGGNTLTDINWTYACYDGTATNYQFAHFDYTASPVTLTVRTNSRYCGFAVRCIRRVAK